jgi:hypothetical protein
MMGRWSNTALRSGVGLATWLAASVAWSQSVGEATNEPDATTEKTPLEGQRNVGVLVAIGSYTGFGGGVQLGVPEVGFRAAAGWAPLLLSYEVPDEDPDLKAYSGYQLAGDVYLRGIEGKRGTNIGVTTGYRYHDLLSSGVALGGYATFPLGKRVDGFLVGGLVWFFSGEDNLRQKKADDLPEGGEFGFPGASINYVISFGIVLFP